MASWHRPSSRSRTSGNTGCQYRGQGHSSSTRRRGWGGGGGRGRCMDVMKLQNLMDDDNLENVTLELTSEKGGFAALLNSPSLGFDEMSLILNVVCKASSSQHNEGLKTVLKTLCSSGFIEHHLVSFIKHLNSKQSIIDTTDSALKIIDMITKKVPKYSQKCLSGLQWLQIALQQHNLRYVRPELEDQRDKLETTIKEKVRKYGSDGEDEPPDNYRELQMFPSPGDDDWLLKPFLRQNKKQGAYPDLDTYLDVQFRLLREDYIQPLRKGIKEYQNFGEGRVPNQLADMWLYHNVHVICSVCNEDVDTRLNFDVSRVGRIRWQSTKRLIYGSLVCLSKDGFQTVMFATVTNRTTRDLLKGVIEVRFEKDFDTILNITPTDTFVMAETPAYFEAYRHVLKRLQDIQDGLPFQDYIVWCNSDVKPPAYLGVSCKNYDMSSLGDSKYERYLSCVPLLNTERWPPLQVYNLNEVQLAAVKTALTKEVAIIQGPPGTGKTYVGLKIMQVLLSNKDRWPGDSSNNVILVVCYTNHALDQFLEGILRFHSDGIIRVGGRSNSDLLKPFNLKEIRYTRRKAKQRKKSVFENYTNCKKKMNQLRIDIESVGVKLEASMLGVMSEETLRPYMLSFHYTSLTQAHRITQKSLMPVWLEFKNPPKPSLSDRKRLALVDEWTKAILFFVNHQHDDPDLNDLEDTYILSIDFIQRVSLYKSWALQFRRNIMTQKSKIEETIGQAESLGKVNSHPILLKLKTQLQMSMNAVLSDELLRQFIPQTIYNSITTSEKYSSCQEGYSVKAWLGASPFLVEEDMYIALQELEDANALSSVANEEADIISSQRILDDLDNLFVRRPGRTAVLLSREVSYLALEFQSTDMSHSEWQSAEQQKYSEHRKKQKKRLDSILMGSPTVSDREAQTMRNVWSLELAQRESLYRYWVKKYQLHLKSSVREKETEYRQVAKRLKEVLQEEDRDILSEADVIGMTTTGAAKHAAVLQTVAPRIIVVEEAAEVLEAHIITTLNPNCQHLILIGDHQQLRPNPTVYELAKTYNLDISLFERLVKNGLHHVTLEYQHRMRPEISVLMKHIYPKLKDHKSVMAFEGVLGVDSNVFFITHEEEEDHINESKSKSNEHEAAFIVALCKYFIQQGYEACDITILAAYTGQISLIKKLMGNDKDIFQEVRLTSVDNFQGEECKIILLSFVRSNDAGSVGFLSTDNRVCVALSRAKVGMFAVGNFKLLARKSNLWSKIVTTLESKGCIGKHLLLRCRNHPEITISASTASDFDQAPKGGCKRVCGFKLKCGHTCKEICHMEDMEHVSHKCQQPCARVFTRCGHRCLRRCFAKCQRCTTIVTKTVSTCGHPVQIQCSLDPETCTSSCGTSLPCGHLCKAQCADCSNTGKHGTCREVIKKEMKCGHVISKYCFSSLPRCTKPCQYKLQCGHVCMNICGDCTITHGKCKEMVSVELECGHVARSFCYNRKQKHTCTQQCNKKRDCGHTCTMKCSECLGSFHAFCDELVEIIPKCGHRLQVKCYKSKMSYICPRECGQTQKCGHRCTGKCRDCVVSGHKLCEEPVKITLNCGHRFSVKCCKSKKQYVCPRGCCEEH